MLAPAETNGISGVTVELYSDPDGDGDPGTDLELQVNWPMPGPAQVIPANTAIA
mgnify:CR=1 FL=1